MSQLTRVTKPPTLSGEQKSAVLFLCLGEDFGSKLMQQLSSTDIQRITKAISVMGEVPAALVNDVMQEFEIRISNVSSVFGSVASARKILNGFLPEDRVTKILDEIAGGTAEDIWTSLSALDTKILANHLGNERNQTAAVVLSKLTSDAAAKVLTCLGKEKSADLIERMINLADVSDETIHSIEFSLKHELLAEDIQNSEKEVESHIVSIFNKLDSSDFNEISRGLEKKIPDKIRAIKEKMFVFDDLIGLDANILSKVMREAGNATLPLALRGAAKKTRDHFLNSLPQRSRDMLKEEMKTMGPVRTSDVKNSQTELVEITLRLASEGVIQLPKSESEEGEMIK